jgi:hypothetical protein
MAVLQVKNIGRILNVEREARLIYANEMKKSKVKKNLKLKR